MGDKYSLTRPKDILIDGWIQRVVEKHGHFDLAQVKAQAKEAKKQQEEATLTKGFPSDWKDLVNMARELGEDFKALAPNLHARWQELDNIYKYRKTNKLLGGS